MSDLLLNSAGDIDVVDNELIIVDGDDAILQHLSIRLKFFLGEWFLDERIGVPYYQDILKKNPNLVAVRTIFRDAILKTPGVESIDRFDLTIDANIRKMYVSFTIKKDDSSILDFSQEFII